MKLIIKQYLASLEERDELDAILPDLLSQMGLIVFSRPGRGTRQDGVDVAAVGRTDKGPVKVYLFSIKPGDLTRTLWDGDSVQSLRPSLNEILDSYIPNRLPEEHKDKEVVICLCLGGDIQEQVRPQVEGYIKGLKKRYGKGKISFEEWNGDKLASLIQTFFLREELLPERAQTQLRKSLALLDEPQSSFLHFSSLVKSLTNSIGETSKAKLTVIRQIYICLWILFAWARDAGNLEAAYLASEFALLNVWEIVKPFFEKRTKSAEAIQIAFSSILAVYQQISSHYLVKLLPHTITRHSLSSATNASCSLDVNLKLFDVLGRVALRGIWSYWTLFQTREEDKVIRDALLSGVQMASGAVIQMIRNNPVLLLPIKDDQSIDISIAILLLMFDRNYHNEIIGWLSEIVDRSRFAHRVNGQYPCILQSYSDLLSHPKIDDEEYKQRVTSGSILFPAIGLWTSLLGNMDLYKKVQGLKEEFLKHCNFQFWYADDSSENLFYTNGDAHGATLSNACIELSAKDYLDQIFGECEHTPYYRSLSAVKSGLWPIVLVACRHYRVPIPVHLWEGFRPSKSE